MTTPWAAWQLRRPIDEMAEVAKSSRAEEEEDRESALPRPLARGERSTRRCPLTDPPHVTHHQLRHIGSAASDCERVA